MSRKTWRRRTPCWSSAHQRALVPQLQGALDRPEHTSALIIRTVAQALRAQRTTSIQSMKYSCKAMSRDVNPRIECGIKRSRGVNA
jgi:phage gp37-like protein